MNDGFKEIEVFNEQDRLKIERSLETARANSVGSFRTQRKTKSASSEIKMIKNKIIAVVLAGVVVIGAVKLIQNSDSTIKMSDLSQEIGSLVYTVPDDFNSRFDTAKVSIVTQNTHRNFNGPWFSQEDIAKDLLRLDSSLFDYAFCTVCVDMGSDINNKVGVGGRSNIDSVIYYLKDYSGVSGSSWFSEYVARELKNVDSLDDYLIAHGYVDESGKPSLEEFKKVCDANAQAILDIVESEAKDKGAKK